MNNFLNADINTVVAIVAIIVEILLYYANKKQKLPRRQTVGSFYKKTLYEVTPCGVPFQFHFNEFYSIVKS